jgi:hypothetical protein
LEGGAVGRGMWGGDPR